MINSKRSQQCSFLPANKMSFMKWTVVKDFQSRMSM